MLNKSELEDILKRTVKIAPFFKDANKRDFIRQKNQKQTKKLDRGYGSDGKGKPDDQIRQASTRWKQRTN